MAAFSMQVPANRLTDVPQIISSYIVVSGEAHVGGNMVAKMHLAIYPDRAEILTKIEKYSSLPSQAQEKMNDYFKKVSAVKQGTSMFVSISGPVLQHESMSREHFDALVKTNSESITYPLVRSVTCENSLKIPESSQVQELLSHVAMLVKSCFPNQKEAGPI